MLSKSTKIKTILDFNRQTIESSSIHAIPNIFRNKFISIKLMWLFSFTISAGLSSMLISNTIVQYFNYEIVTKTEVKYESKLIFPIITICNLNFFSTEYANDLIFNMFNTNYPLIEYYHLSKAWSNHFSKDLTKNFDHKLIGNKFNETIINCKFGISDCKNELEYFYHFEYGNCLRFNGNSTKSKYVYKKGELNAFMIKLFGGKASDNNYAFSVNNGFRVFITPYLTVA